MNRSWSVWIGLILAGVCLAPGCGKSVKLVPVSGKVTLGNQLVSGGQVSLVPESKDEKTPGLITGNIDSSGNYKILTNGKDGAPLGKYKVTVTPSMMPMDPKAGPQLPFAKEYGDPRKTKLSIEVVENPAPGAYDLKMQK